MTDVTRLPAVPTVVATAAPAIEGAPAGAARWVEANPLCPELPIFDLSGFLENPESEDAALFCREVADCMRRTSLLLVRDPRVQEEDNERFLDQMERYFSQSREAKMRDVRADLSYQVGATPEGTEVPRSARDHSVLEGLGGATPGGGGPEEGEASARVPRAGSDDAPVTPTGADAKWRFFWRAGRRPASSAFPELNAPAVIPDDFPGWAQTMDSWAEGLLGAGDAVSRALGVGLGIGLEALASLLSGGPHLLAPTGSDLGGDLPAGTVLAGYHADLNLLTLHGRARFPGLRVWTPARPGVGGAEGRSRAIRPRLPPGALLVQAGMQLERLTGGAIRAGFHEVVATDEVLELARARAAAGLPAWRVSSTLFAHVNSDRELRPLGPFADAPGALERYPPILAGDQVREELRAISLA